MPRETVMRTLEWAPPPGAYPPSVMLPERVLSRSTICLRPSIPPPVTRSPAARLPLTVVPVISASRRIATPLPRPPATLSLMTLSMAESPAPIAPPPPDPSAILPGIVLRIRLSTPR